MGIPRYLVKKRAKKLGEGFENHVEMELKRAGFLALSIEDGCKMIIKNGQKKLIKVSQPFDFVAIGPGPEYDPIYFDAKARSGAAVVRPSWLKGNHKKIGKYYRPDSTMQQRLVLQEICARGHIGGFLVLLADTGEIRWVMADRWSTADVDSISWGFLGGPLKIRFR